MLEATLIISGKVQGVFFRNTTKKYADKLDIRGYVRNRTDGTVEAVAQGDEEFLKKFIEWCREGPDMAQVDDVKVNWKSIPNPTYARFEIKQ